MNRDIAQYRLHPVTDHVFPFEEAPEAFAYFEKGRHFGKVAIRHG